MIPMTHVLAAIGAAGFVRLGDVWSAGGEISKFGWLR